ncbi:hypothetical protein EG850_12245 [Gulosibacter macacae]|uniref:Polymer-forming cytoskeletal protein n=2 Tax=Gulosibacter macacae TaxID=2488791 RepID=A0A3P3VVN4_9MICO|nr:hypothetical protein EG850_12245 [Gulosibacter macacae]
MYTTFLEAPESPPIESLLAVDSDLVVIDGETYRHHRFGGGLVAVTATVGPHVYVAPGARIRGHAIVDGAVRLFHTAVIEDHAIVTGLVTLRGESSIGGSAFVKGGILLYGTARVAGTAFLIGTIRVNDGVVITDGDVRGRFTLA